MKNDFFQIALEDNLNLFLRLHRTHHDGVKPGTFCSENIRKDLISHKKCVIRLCPHPADSFQVSFRQWLSRLVNVTGMYLFAETFHSRLPVIGDQAGLKSHSMESLKELYGARVRRSSM